jgi:phage shock protein C
MICQNCQRDAADYSSFCPFCGAPQRVPSSGQSKPFKRLTRSTSDRKIAGVCGGIAEYFDIDSTFVRLIWVLLILLPIPLVPAFLGYFVAWVIMPKAPRFTAAPAQQPPVIIPNSAQTAQF